MFQRPQEIDEDPVIQLTGRLRAQIDEAEARLTTRARGLSKSNRMRRDWPGRSAATAWIAAPSWLRFRMMPPLPSSRVTYTSD